MKSSESGNVLFYILIAVSLIAALSYAVSQSMRGGNSGVNTERANLLAGEILEYGNILANATSQLRLRGCTETQISFAGNSDECDVLDINGGGINLAQVPPEISANGWIFSAAMDIAGIGTTNGDSTSTDLVAYIENVNESVCEAVNTLSNISSPELAAIQNGYNVTPFSGTYTYFDTVGDQGDSATGTLKLSGQKAGCFQSPNSSGQYVFYRVLIAR